MTEFEAVAPFDVDRVSNEVNSVMLAVVNAAANLGVSLPTRQIVGPGTVPYDCEQVVVSIQMVVTGAPENHGQPTTGTWPPGGEANMTMFTGTFLVAIVRNANAVMNGANGTVPPNPDQYLADLTQASADVAVLEAAANQIAAANISATPRTVTTGSPQGGLVAVTMRIQSLI